MTGRSQLYRNQWTGFYIIGTFVMKELMGSIIIIKAQEPLITYEKSERGCQSQKKNLKGADQTIIKPVAI